MRNPKMYYTLTEIMEWMWEIQSESYTSDSAEIIEDSDE